MLFAPLTTNKNTKNKNFCTSDKGADRILDREEKKIEQKRQKEEQKKRQKEIENNRFFEPVDEIKPFNEENTTTFLLKELKIIDKDKLLSSGDIFKLKSKPAQGTASPPQTGRGSEAPPSRFPLLGFPLLEFPLLALPPQALAPPQDDAKQEDAKDQTGNRDDLARHRDMKYRLRQLPTAPP